MKNFFKDESGSITIMAYVVMLFLSIYGAIILGNSSRKFQNQTSSIKTIQNSYSRNMSNEDLIRLYEKIGGEKMVLDSE